MNNNFNDSESEKIFKIKKDYTYQFFGMLLMFVFTTFLIFKIDFFNLLPKEHYGNIFSNPGSLIVSFFFFKYLSNISVEINSIINPEDNNDIKYKK